MRINVNHAKKTVFNVQQKTSVISAFQDTTCLLLIFVHPAQKTVLPAHKICYALHAKMELI